MYVSLSGNVIISCYARGMVLPMMAYTGRLLYLWLIPILWQCWFPAVKRDAKFWARYLKGVPFVNRRYTKSWKMVYKRLRGGPPPYKNLLSTHPPDLFKQTLTEVMFHIITRAYESCSACQTPISNWIDRCFGLHSWNSVHSLSRDNPRIPTNPLLEGQQPPLLWGQWIRTKSCLKLTQPLRPCLTQTDVTFQLHRTWRGFLLTV